MHSQSTTFTGDPYFAVNLILYEKENTKNLRVVCILAFGKAHIIATLIKVRPLHVGGNSRGMNMLNEPVGLKIVVNPDDVTVRGVGYGPMNGITAKQYWEKQKEALIVRCNDVRDLKVPFQTGGWKIRENRANPK